MSDFNLIYTAIQSLAAQSEAQYASLLQRLDHINGTVRRHDADLTEVTLKQEACQKRCGACIEELEPIVRALDNDMKVAKQVGKGIIVVLSTLITAGVALLGLL